jgi:hypothetical protein
MIINIIINITIIINMKIHSPFTPPTLFGVSCRDKKITPKLTWNPMQARSEPKLHPQRANMEFVNSRILDMG